MRCPKCGGQGFLVYGPMTVTPVSAFDAPYALAQGRSVQVCWGCDGDGRVSPSRADRVRFGERLRNQDLVEVLGR